MQNPVVQLPRFRQPQIPEPPVKRVHLFFTAEVGECRNIVIGKVQFAAEHRPCRGLCLFHFFLAGLYEAPKLSQAPVLLTVQIIQAYQTVVQGFYFFIQGCPQRIPPLPAEPASCIHILFPGLVVVPDRTLFQCCRLDASEQLHLGFRFVFGFKLFVLLPKRRKALCGRNRAHQAQSNNAKCGFKRLHSANLTIFV